MTFEPNKRYKLRNGATVRLTRIDANPIWPFLVGVYETPSYLTGCKQTWCPDGSYQAAPEAETQLDIIEEIKGEADALL